MSAVLTCVVGSSRDPGKATSEDDCKRPARVSAIHALSRCFYVRLLKGLIIPNVYSICYPAPCRCVFGPLVQAQQLFNMIRAVGVDSTTHNDEGPQALFLHNSTKMTHLRSSQTTQIGEGSLGNPLCFFPNPFQSDRLAHCGPLAQREQLTFAGLRFNDPFTSITQALGRPFLQTLETNPRRKGNAGLKGQGLRGLHHSAKLTNRTSFRNTQHTLIYTLPLASPFLALHPPPLQQRQRPHRGYGIH